MWNNCKGERTGPSFPPCSHLFSGRDLQIPPLEFGSLTMGPPAQGLSAAGLETPFPPASHPPQSRPATGGAKAAMPNDICRFRLQASTRRQSTRAPPDQAGQPAPAAPAAPQPRSRHGLQARGSLVPRPPRPRSPPDCCAGEEGGEIRPPGLAQRHYLARAVAPACGRARGHRAAGLGKRSFSMEPQARHSRSGHSSGAATARANAPRLPRRRTPRKALPAAPRVPAAPGERTPRAHGRTPPHTHSHALHTHGVPAPPRCPGTAGSPHRARAPPSSRHPSPSSGVQGPARRGRGSPRPPLPGGRPARPGFPSTARAPCARPRHQAGRKGRRRDWGWHRESGTGAPPSPPPPARHHLFCSTKGCSRNRRPRATLPEAHSSSTSAAPGAAEPESRAGKARGCGAETRAEAACRASGVPSPLPPPSAPATARRRPRPAPARLPALLRLQRRSPSAEPASRAPPDTRGRAGPREKGAKGAGEVGRRRAELLAEEREEGLGEESSHPLSSHSRHSHRRA